MNPHQAQSLIGQTAASSAPRPIVSARAGGASVLGIASGKGGVGKSTLAVNLATAAAMSGAQTLLAAAFQKGRRRSQKRARCDHQIVRSVFRLSQTRWGGPCDPRRENVLGRRDGVLSIGFHRERDRVVAGGRPHIRERVPCPGSRGPGSHGGEQEERENWNDRFRGSFREHTHTPHLCPP